MAYQITLSPNHSKNQDKYGHPNGGYRMPCFICARIVDRRKPHFMVHFGFGGMYAVTEEENATDLGGDLGCYPVGPECLREQPELKAYGWKESGVTHDWNGEPVPPRPVKVKS